MLAREVLEAVHETIRRHHVTYDEYNALKAWLINVGEDGEWPLFLDVWVEHVVEEVNSEHREGSKGTIEGPYYVPDAPELGPEGTLPMRDGRGRHPAAVPAGHRHRRQPLRGAKVEIWHADDDGYYSQFAPGIPEWNLRGTVTADEDGTFGIHTMRPRPTRSRPTAPAAS